MLKEGRKTVPKSPPVVLGSHPWCPNVLRPPLCLMAASLHHSTEFDTVITAESKGLDRRRESELSEKETNATAASLPDGAVNIVGCTGVTSLGGVGPHPAFHASG